MGNKYLSYGGGINSTAMMILLRQQNINFEAVFVDHGGDYPETYEYVKMLQDKDYPITIIKAMDWNKRAKGLTLTDYCAKYRIMPSRQQRWCTAEFKIIPLYNYFKRPCVVYIGFDYGEKNRAKMSYEDNIENIFPLIDAKIDREKCKEIILNQGLSLPRKSGCFYCPFQRINQFIRLRDDHPDLWCITKKIENDFLARRAEKGKSPYYLKSDMPLDRLVREGQDDLFGWRKPCQCGQ